MEIELAEIIVDEEIEIGDMELDVVKVYPELEDLEVTPSTEEQNFKSSKYGFNNVKVKPMESGIKQFASVEEMNVSTGNNEGDLAIVYNVTNEGAVMEQDTLFNYLYLPETITLSKQYFNVVSNTLIPTHQMGSGVVVANKSFKKELDYINFIQFGFGSNDGLAYTGAIQYGSTDGIVFSRLDSAGPRGVFDLIADWQFKDGFVWDDILKEIMLLEIENGGIYKYKNGNWKKTNI